MDLLRFTTAGSVDDGKSTLIGRLLYDSKSIFEDRLEAIERTSKASGETEVNLALLTDGLRAEREQKITIDVAYHYFATPQRKFIIADTPGHTQYTRNMVTGASTADLAIVLIDAQKGVLVQSRRHAFIASLLQIPHLVVAINKMDSVDYDEKVFDQIMEEFTQFSAKLDMPDIVFIPISALKGDNIVQRSTHMPWYDGPTLLYLLEHVHVEPYKNLIDFRFPVQYVVRPHQQFRGFAGRVSSGAIRVGEPVKVLPSGKDSAVKSIVTYAGELEEARAGDSVVLTLEDEIDISRGDMLVRVHNTPVIGRQVDAYLCWMDETPMEPGRLYELWQTSHTGRASIGEVRYKMDMETMHRLPSGLLLLNDIALVSLQTTIPFFWDTYRQNQHTGSFILIDPDTHNTVAAGMVRQVNKESIADLPQAPAGKKSADVVWEGWNINRASRESRNGHQAAVLWFTGLSGSGKSTIGRLLEQQLFDRGIQTMLLDGDHLRHGLCNDLGFSEADRSENIRRAAEVARLFYEQGNIVICTFISPFAKDRQQVRELIPEGRFLEVWANCDLDTAIARDPKGLYARALRGEIAHFTGINSPYEPPENPEITLHTATEDSEAAARRIVEELTNKGII
ncbi:MAG: sulfate adenylyltransferase subunit CysN [Saprospiraceae bacterium]|nr:sulfate adenylyltransferase subunit CysN [Saprospiraceae bacterium]